MCSTLACPHHDHAVLAADASTRSLVLCMRQDRKTHFYKKIVEEAANARPGVLELMDEGLNNPYIAMGICSAATRAGNTLVHPPSSLPPGTKIHTTGYVIGRLATGGGCLMCMLRRRRRRASLIRMCKYRQLFWRGGPAELVFDSTIRWKLPGARIFKIGLCSDSVDTTVAPSSSASCACTYCMCPYEGT